jgi:Ca2+-binding EF-hand superfamily protein
VGHPAGRRRYQRVALADVLTVVDQLAQMPQAVTGTAEATFEAVDENADGHVSPAEYRQMIEAWTGREADTSDAFELLDLDHDGYLSQSEFAEHWTEFWAGDNLDAVGSCVFGTFPATASRG